MKRFLLVAALVALSLADSNAAGPRRFFARERPRPVVRTVQATANLWDANGPSSARGKSEYRAARGMKMPHVGTRPNPGTFEGVGYSSSNPTEALSMCCTSPSHPQIIDSAVVRGATGWFATKIFARS